MIDEDGNCVGKKGDREMKEYIYDMIDLRNALEKMGHLKGTKGR